MKIYHSFFCVEFMNKNILKYINIDQKACKSFELQSHKDMTLKHCTILDYLIKQIRYKQTSKLKDNYIERFNNDVYVRIDYKNIILDLPLLKIKDKKAIKRHIKLLVDLGLIKRTIKYNTIYYRLTKLSYKFMLFNNDNKDTHKNYKLDDKYKNIKNFIVINQHAFIKLAHKYKIRITLKHSTILDYIYYFTQTRHKDVVKCRKTINKKLYTWISYNKIIDDLPIIKINNKISIARYINDLINCNIIEKYTVYQGKKAFTYFRITEQGKKAIFKNASLQDDNTYYNDQDLESTQTMDNDPVLESTQTMDNDPVLESTQTMDNDPVLESSQAVNKVLHQNKKWLEKAKNRNNQIKKSRVKAIRVNDTSRKKLKNP